MWDKVDKYYCTFVFVVYYHIFGVGVRTRRAFESRFLASPSFHPVGHNGGFPGTKYTRLSRRETTCRNTGSAIIIIVVVANDSVVVCTVPGHGISVLSVNHPLIFFRVERGGCEVCVTIFHFICLPSALW